MTVIGQLLFIIKGRPIASIADKTQYYNKANKLFTTVVGRLMEKGKAKDRAPKMSGVAQKRPSSD